jgi:hypothetical protein
MVGAPSTNYFGKPHPMRVWLFYIHVKKARDNEEKGEGGQNKSDFSSNSEAGNQKNNDN